MDNPNHPDFYNKLYNGPAEGARNCRRSKMRRSLTDVNAGLQAARMLFGKGNHLEAFDLYEQLADTYTEHRIPILAEAFDCINSLPDKENRYHLYQARYFDFGIRPSDRVLDIGSGNLPFPYATHLADFSLSDGNVGRAGEAFKLIEGKAVYECDIEDLPFSDKEFDFVYCSHVLEHVNDPQKACSELMRVAKRGYIETPTRGKDLWLNTAEISNHKWAVEFLHGLITFTEYTPEEINGLKCDVLMGMHCNPQTQREKAFSALIYLKADLINTMYYWEDEFNIEVRRLSNKTNTADLLPHSTPAGEPALRVITTHSEQDNTCLFLNTYYEKFLTDHYRSNPDLQNASYQVQKSSLQSTCFGDCDFYSRGLKKAGWRSEDLIVNCNLLQESWSRENGCNSEGLSIAIEQIRRRRPQVVYMQDLGIATRDFLAAIRPHVTLIVGQIASPIPPQADLAGFDIIISSFPHFVARLRQAGMTAYYQPLAFDPLILDKIGHCRKTYPVTFVGGISPVHGKGTELLEQLARLTPLEFWGYGADTLPSGSPISDRHHGEIWGLEMFRLLAQSGITINRHIDVAENHANNMRLFEATGCGALLITDYKDNLNDLFEIGKEIVVYRSVEECAALINYYLANPAAAESIAKAGQARTLRDHKYDQRMEQTAEILSRHLQYRHESRLFQAPDMDKISCGYSRIAPADVTPDLTSAWQDEGIPLSQRALVQNELQNMYKGDVPLPFRVLVELLQPVAVSGMKMLEIGCASGYYYEALEYLLCKRIAYTGVDYSEAMVDMARNYYPRARFEVADGACLPFESRSFPVVVSGGVLLHTPDYDRQIAETCWVADNWVVVHRTPICRKNPTRYFSKLAYGVETVELHFNEKEILDLFASNGFELNNAVVYAEHPDEDEYEASYLLKRRATVGQTVTPSHTPVTKSIPPKPVAGRNGPVVLVSRAIAFTFPLSYAYLAGYLRAHGEEVVVLFKDEPYETLVKRIMELNPLIVGFGNLYPELEEIRLLIRMLDEAGRRFPIVIGGQMVSPIPEFALRITGADFGIIGEGEIILHELVCGLREGSDFSGIKGIVIRNGGDIQNNGPGPCIENLTTGLPPIPYDLFPTDQWLPIGAWYAKNLPVPHWKLEDRVINVHGGRGCPFTCNFCYHHSKPRYRDISVMMAEAQESLRRFNGNMLYFSDDLVLATPARARRLLEAIGNLDRPISFSVSTRFDILARMDDQLLRDFKRAGCRIMGLGLESGSDRILKIIGKNCTAQQIEDGLERLRLVGIYPTTTIMVGQYTETLEDVAASLALMQRTVRRDPYLNYAFTLTTPFPGSPLHGLLFEKGFIKDEQEFYDRYFSTPGDWKQVVNLSAMTDAEVMRAIAEMQRVYDEEKNRINYHVAHGVPLQTGITNNVPAYGNI
jgi:radical SAM superfamily enzyme YgiQ (UPF0313 family)/ubiquinone/menaquinone biosynthesis C-methylase UbiE